MVDMREESQIRMTEPVVSDVESVPNFILGFWIYGGIF